MFETAAIEHINPQDVTYNSCVTVTSMYSSFMPINVIARISFTVYSAASVYIVEIQKRSETLN